MSKPVRIQRKRIKGWKMPPNTVYVGRPTKWGNPFHIGSDCTAQEAVMQFTGWIAARDSDYARSGRMTDGPYSFTIRNQLRGKNLACFCPLDKPCHASVLLEIANS